MSYKDGWAAINLQMPDRVPRTEYSADFHWDLIKAVTGIDAAKEDKKEIYDKASFEFRKAWNYDFVWSTYTYNQIFNGYYTKMGHAEYNQGGKDFDNEISCPFEEPEDVLNFDPWDKFGIIDKKAVIKEYEEEYRKSVERTPSAVNMTGIYVTLISGMIELFGWDMLLLAAGTDQKKFGEMSNRYASWIMQYFEALAEADIPCVMIHDDIVWTSGAFIAPSWYREYIFPNYKKLFSPIIESGKKLIYTSDGTYTQFVDDIISCGVHGLVMEPTTDMKYIAEKYGKTHCFIGNADTRILLSGTKEAIYNEVKRCMDIGKSCPGYIMAVGNHIPSNTPIENALYYNEVYEKLSRR